MFKTDLFKTVFASQRAALETKLASARDTIKRLEFLVHAGAEPPVKLALVQDSTRELEVQNLEQLSHDRRRSSVQLRLRSSRSAVRNWLERQTWKSNGFDHQ